VLDVADTDPAAPPSSRETFPGAGGLGRRMVRHVAAEVGWYIQDDSKRVGAQFALPTA
jgi:hypothetical protein